MTNFVFKLPKIELHAHLNGSLSDDTLNKLVELRRKSDPSFAAPNLINFSKFRSLSECFDVFKIAHDLVDCPEAVKIAVDSVIREFHDENVVYLELRSTPRETVKMTKLNYLETIVEAMISCQVKYPNIIVKYLPSINISYGVNEAEVNYELFKKLREKYPKIVVGIDLSGDPTKGRFADVKHIYEKARLDGFGIALHCAEVDNQDEILEKLKFMQNCDRIGHGTFIDEKNEQVWRQFTAKKIPVEICLTSNILCKSVKSYEDHHITRLLKLKHPITICTDDYGVFKTSLTREFEICEQIYKLSMTQMVEIVETANKISFASEFERQVITEKINKFKLTITTAEECKQ